MSEQQALVRAILATPDDYTPRLVYADWLEENGESKRARFIRLQIKHHTLKSKDVYIGDLDQLKAEEVWLKATTDLRQDDWVWHRAPLRSRLLSRGTVFHWNCGFVEAITCRAEVWFYHADRVYWSIRQACRPKRECPITAHPISAVKLTTSPMLVGAGKTMTWEGYPCSLECEFMKMSEYTISTTTELMNRTFPGISFSFHESLGRR